MASAAATARAFWRSDDGATAVEYCMIGAFLSIMIVAGAKSIGLNLSPYFSKLAGNLT